MYENITVEDIKKDILTRYQGDAQTNEGGYTNDMISGIAYKIWTTLQSLDKVIPIAFVDENSGEYIDKRCEDFGIKRKLGQKAVTTLTITGAEGTEIEKGKIFVTDDDLEFETDDDVTIVNGTAKVSATALEIGTKYNVPEGTITTQISSSQGINTVTNTQATGGTETETDESLLTRLHEHMRNPATSGNPAHYKEWALEVNGVGDARVVPIWNGPGTVKVIIIGNDKKPVDETIVNNCYQHIEEKRPIGPSVTVESAIGVEINVNAKLIIDDTTTIHTVITKFTEVLSDYFYTLAFQKNTVVYNRISHMLLDIPGVEDYTTLTINGATNNIDLQEYEVPILGTMEVTE